jgi:hypothetical protein
LRNLTNGNGAGHSADDAVPVEIDAMDVADLIKFASRQD